jgi:hypothetical protein
MRFLVAPVVTNPMFFLARILRAELIYVSAHFYPQRASSGHLSWGYPPTLLFGERSDERRERKIYEHVAKVEV